MNDIMHKHKVLVISGPTGAGESTITNKLIEMDKRFIRLVTATTRPPREGEQNGVDYYFMSQDVFKNAIKTGDIIEYTYVKSRDVYYGSYKPDLEKKLNDGYIVIVNPDIVGAKYYKERYNAVTIFIMPKSIEELRDRLMKRDQTSVDEIDIRIEDAKREINEEREYYDYEVINENGKLNEAIEEIMGILAKEEYMR